MTADWVSWAVPKPDLRQLVRGALGLGNELSEDRPWQGTFYLVAMYDRALRRDPRHSQAHLRRGDLFFSRGEGDEALEHGTLPCRTR